MPETVQRTIRVTTTQHVLEDVAPAAEGFPMRKWSIQLSLIGADGIEYPANVFDRVTYKLHPTFQNPNRTIKKVPFRIEEQGWGEFDMVIAMHVADKGGEHSVSHDLNFRQSEYIVDHKLNFPVNRPALARILAESGPVPGYNGPGVSGIEGVGGAGGIGGVGVDAGLGAGGFGGAAGVGGIAGGLTSAAPGAAAAGAGTAASTASRSKKRKATIEKGNVDLERLAEGLQKLGEDDLLVVVQMVTDNKTPEMFVKNDVDEGEFHMDLCTLPDRLLKSLWDYVRQRVEV